MRRVPAPPPALIAALLTGCVLLGGPLLGGGCSPPDRPVPVTLPVGPDDLPDEADFLARIDRSRGRRDVFAVIRDPKLVPAAQAPRMVPEELVLGLDLGDVQIAYPTRLLNLHEIVEHTVRGFELLAVW